ncbi:MAG TPA: PepSY domain-containing protein [Gaiellaceae bacterium]|nr:PepSY domain-containing protein [Gaiellaceae bacterium]
MNRRMLIIIAGLVAVLALALGGVAIAGATGAFDDEGNLSGPQADQAKAVALRITHGGKVNAVERDSEKGATYEVEVTRPDGKTVDVRLDASYKLVAVDGDSEGQDSGDDG